LGARTAQFSFDIRFELRLLGHETYETVGSRGASQCIAAKHAGDVGARYVNLVGKTAEDVTAGISVACEKSIAFTVYVTVGGAASDHSACSVGVGGFEFDAAMRVHSVQEGAKVAGALWRYMIKSSEFSQSGGIATDDDGEVSLRSQLPTFESKSVSHVSFRLPCVVLTVVQPFDPVHHASIASGAFSKDTVNGVLGGGIGSHRPVVICRIGRLATTSITDQATN